jgi:hypothetical protein
LDFIHYHPAEEPLLVYDDSSDEMVFDDLVIQYSEVQILVDIDTVRVPGIQPTEMGNPGLKRFKRLRLQNIRNIAWIKQDALFE